MELFFIRHSITNGNLEKRYIGKRTDEPLCPEGIKLAEYKAKSIQLLKPEKIYTSPMKRCIQTAEILFPCLKKNIISDFSECDFGKFEGKNYYELNGYPEYQNWIDSGGILPFPDGESKKSFTERCCKAITELVRNEKSEKIAIIAHGGTFMAILSEMEESQKSYFEWKIPFCEPIIVKKSPHSYSFKIVNQ